MLFLEREVLNIRIILPKIHGIDGRIRQRYPIMPVHGEGSSFWKKLNAFEDSINLSDNSGKAVVTYKTGESTSPYLPTHQHVIVITKAEYASLFSKKVDFIKKATEPDNFHRHILTLKLKSGSNPPVIEISACDSGAANGRVCFDGHKNVVILIK